MDILILNNFGFFPTQPPPNTSYIVGLLRSKGFKTVQIDLSVELWDYFLSQEYLEKRELKPENLSDSSCPFCPPITIKRFNNLKKDVTQNIERAKRILRDENQFFDIKKLNWAVQVIFQAQQVIYYHYGTFLAGKTVYWPYIKSEVNSLKDIYTLSEDREHNLFIEAFETEIIPRIKQMAPSLIGIDIIFPWEIVQALTLNRLLKKDLPKTHINFLGYGFDEFCFARVKDRLRTNQRLFLDFDSLFLVRNDRALCDLVSLENRSPQCLKKIESLAYINNGSMEINSPFEEGSIDFDIFPDYSDLPLNKYLVPKLVLIDKISNKCFWSRCNFCSINSYKKSRQESDIEKFIDRLIYYKDRYGCNHIFLLDESVPPDQALLFSEGLLKRKPGIKWSLRTRIDKGFDYTTLKKMYLAGCRDLWIGLETISPRLLKLMNKASIPEKYPEMAVELMKNCNEIGIGLHFCLILGFPSETDEDRKALVEFFRKNNYLIKKIPLFVTFNTFSLIPGSKVFNNPEEFNITEIIRNENNFNMISIPYKTAFHDDTGSAHVQKYINETTEELTDIFVRNRALQWLWLFSSDSSYELLLKEHFYTGNPFQKKDTLLERLLTLFSVKIEQLPYLAEFYKVFLRKWVVGIS